MVLSQEEIDGCREAFLAFDKDRSGTIDVWELRQVLEAMGQVGNLYIYIYAIGTVLLLRHFDCWTQYSMLARCRTYIYPTMFCKEFWSAYWAY